MGLFTVRLTVAHPLELGRQAEVELWVDTGATLSWIPRAVVETLDMPRLKRRSFVVADGRSVERETAGARLHLNGKEAIVTVVVAEPGDGHLLGATALEALGFAVDPEGRRLVPRELVAM